MSINCVMNLQIHPEVIIESLEWHTDVLPLSPRAGPVLAMIEAKRRSGKREYNVEFSCRFGSTKEWIQTVGSQSIQVDNELSSHAGFTSCYRIWERPTIAGVLLPNLGHNCWSICEHMYQNSLLPRVIALGMTRHAWVNLVTTLIASVVHCYKHRSMERDYWSQVSPRINDL